MQTFANPNRLLVFKLSTIAFFLLGATGCIKPVVIEGTAMSPTLADGERWFVTMNPGEIQRGDIIEFRYPKDETKRYVKRVVGLPGETIEIRAGVVHINGAPLPEGYLPPESNNKAGSSFPEKRVPENHFYVLGDNRDNSADSRYWGTVDRSLIEGKLYMRYSSGK